MIRRVLVALGWVVAVGLAVVALDVVIGPVRASAVDVAAFAPWVLLAAWPLALAALLRRRWVLGGAGVLLVLFQLVVIGPAFAPWHSPPAAAAGTAFTVYDQNVEYDNTDLTKVAAQITADHPDVVVLEELSYENWPSLQRSGAVAGYAYQKVLLNGGARGYGLWSRLPMSDVSRWSAGGLGMLQATAATPGGPVHVLAVHTIAPTTRATTTQWSRSLHDIAARVRITPGPVVVVGDFNAVASMPQLRRVQSAGGLRDAAAMDGEGWRQTWPADGRLPIRMLRIDHVLLSRELTVTSYRVGRGGGSDHAAVLVTLARRR